MSEGKEIKFSFSGTIEVPDDSISVSFNSSGSTLEEFRELVGKLIAVEYAQFHNESIASIANTMRTDSGTESCDRAEINTTLSKALELLRNIEDGRDGDCDVDNSMFCQSHMAYVEQGETECFYKNIANFVDHIDNDQIQTH